MTAAAITVIGESSRVAGYALTGAQVRAVEDADGIRAAWRDLPADGLIVLTATAADLLRRSDVDIWARLVAVMP